jgi:hypothetical protein
MSLFKFFRLKKKKLPQKCDQKDENRETTDSTFSSIQRDMRRNALGSNDNPTDAMRLIIDPAYSSLRCNIHNDD